MALPIDLSQPPRATLVAVVHFGPGRFQWRVDGQWTLATYPEAACLVCDGRRLSVPARGVALFPPGSSRTYEAAHTEIHAVAHFHATAHALDGAVHDLGTDFPAFHQALAEAAAWWPERPTRVQARLWELLWRLEDRGSAPARLPPSMERARVHLERNLGDPLTVGDLARAAGCSTSQLLRLVRAACGCPVTVWMRRHRVERAQVLLASSPLPIAEVGRHVGLPDPQHFNKVFRAVTGLSPRAWRERQGQRDIPG